jgi:hypothetical protein
MTSSRPWRDVADAVQAALLADPALADAGIAVAGRWVAAMATPAVVCAPTRRYVVKPCDVRWDLVLQILVPVASDDDEVLHALLELALANLPSGVLVGEPTYAVDSTEGTSLVVSSTTLSA